MGEISDMMLDGTLCEGCGVYMGGDENDEPLGFPQLCPACRGDDEDEEDQNG